MTTYRLLQKIGEGSYSQVYKAVNQRTHQLVAIKIIQPKNAPQQYVQQRQIKILKDCSHPHLASLLQSFKYQNSIYLVFEYIRMNLSEYYRYFKSFYNKNLELTQIIHIIMQISSALAYLHSKNIIHRDIKPENIMIDPHTLTAKLIDFGFAKYQDPNKCTGYMVTRWYRPLEIVLGLSYGQKVDIFALGAIFLELINGLQIFRSESNLQQMYQLLNICGLPQPSSRQAQALQKYNIVPTNTNQLRYYTRDLKSPIRELILSMLSSSARNRPSIQQVLQILSANTEPKKQVRKDSLQKAKRRVLSVSHGLTLISASCHSRQKTRVKNNDKTKKYELSSKLKDTSKETHPRLCKIFG